MKDGKIPLVAGYDRVSSLIQAKEGISLEAQRDSIKKYCEAKGWKLYRIYEDAGRSGGNIDKRLAFKEMISDAKAGKFDIILVSKIDRFSRNLKDMIYTMDELKKYKIDFVSITETLDTTTAMGEAFFYIIGIFAQLERKLTKERLSITLGNKFDRGILIGRMPIGYKWNKEKKCAELDPEKAPMIKDIFNLAAKGTHYNEICAKYDLKPQSYYNIIHNKTYIGMVEFQGKLIKGKHEAIINQELFEKLQR